MGSPTPPQTPEGRLIEGATKASGRSIRSLAANADISDTRWRHIIKGWQPVSGGSHAPVRAPASTLARMALVLGLTAEQLTAAGREDAVAELNRLGQESAERAAAGTPMPETVRGSASMGHPVAEGALDEIEMIYHSQMTTEEKIAAIRYVLKLRAKLEAEARAASGDATASGEATETRPQVSNNG